MKITKVDVTEDLIHGRGGLSLLMKYIGNIGFLTIISSKLGHLRKSKKGQEISEVLRQILAYFIDGTRTSISGFNDIRNDKAYAAMQEVETSQLIGSDIVKRFFNKFKGYGWIIFRSILHELFVWRLNIQQPKVIELYIDTMVLNNDDAEKREGVSPTYKNVKGYQPLHVIWGKFIVDALFRCGKKHSNYGNNVQTTIKKLVELIRKRYRPDVPIILKCDSGFLSEENLDYFNDQLGISYICGGKLYDYIKDYADQCPASDWSIYENNHGYWGILEFGQKLKSWISFKRAIYTSQLEDENHQLLLSFAASDTLLYTNLGKNAELDKQLAKVSTVNYSDTTTIVSIYHQNGTNELAHRGIKELITKETLPFKRFGMNAALYYVYLIAFFLTECFRQDVCTEIQPVYCYPDTLRRKLIDFAVKIVKTGRQIILKTTKETWDRLNFPLLWEKCHNPPLMC